MGHHRYVKVNMVVWLTDPSPEGETTGPPDDELAADYASKITNVKGKGKGKDHKVEKTQVTSTQSQTTKP